MGKVYVVCEPLKKVHGVDVPAMDLSPAAEHGELVVLLPHSQSLLSTVPTVRALKEKLRSFSDEDFILPIGDPVLMSTVAVVASYQNSGRVKMLKWDKNISRYLPIQIDISGKAI